MFAPLHFVSVAQSECPPERADFRQVQRSVFTVMLNVTRLLI